MRKEGHFLAGIETSEYLGNLEKREFQPNLQVLQASLIASFWLGFLASRGHLKVNLRLLMKNPSKDLKEPIWSIAILAIFM